MLRIRDLLPLLATIAVSGAAFAQSWPAKPVRFVVGYAPGGSVDVTARIFARRLTQTLGQQVLVDNRPGAASNIAAELVAKAPPDGYTLFYSSGTGLGTNLAMYRRMPYNPLKDFAPIVLLCYQGNILIVNPSVPVKTVKDLIALATARPGVLNYGTAGNGTSQHMSAALFSVLTGVKMVQVPYKGGAPALADLLGGQIDLMFQTLPEAIPHLGKGRVRPIAVTGLKRSAVLPEVPTIAESGVPGFEFQGFLGIAGPAALPREIVARLNAEANKALASPEVKARLVELGLDLVGSTPEQLGEHMRVESEKQVRLAKRVGLTPVD